METTRILIVEPEGMIAADLGRRLTKMGHAVTETATGGEQALETMEGTRPDLVFIDLSLPEPLTAVETARRIRGARNVPVVYLASDAEAASRHDATTSEPFGCVLTTFNNRELHAAIEFALYRHRIDAKLLTPTSSASMGLPGAPRSAAT